MNPIAESIHTYQESKQFRPAGYDNFMRYLNYVDTEEKLFSRMTYWFVFQGLPNDQNEKFGMVKDRARELKLWNGLELKIKRWREKISDEFTHDQEGFAARMGEEYADYCNHGAPDEEKTPGAPLCLGDIPSQQTEWLVPNVLPLGEISLLGADGGTGKGIWQAQLIAYVTAGKTSGFFPQPPQKTGNVLILAGEDDPGKVLKGRLLAAGADMSRVLVVTADEYYNRTGTQLCIKDKALADFVDEAEPLLLILDPLQSFLPANVEMASRNQMRGSILPLKGISTAKNLATLIVMHTNKKQGVSGRGRLADSSDIWDIARSVLMMGHSKNDGKIYLSHEKSSYSKPEQTILMHIEDVRVENIRTAKAVFDGYTDKKDADFIEERRFRVAQTKDDTAEAIKNILAESRLGSMPNNQLRAEVMKEVRCSEPTYKRAYAELVRTGEVTKFQLNQKSGVRGWFTRLSYCGGTGDTETDI